MKRNTNNQSGKVIPAKVPQPVSPPKKDSQHGSSTS